MGAERLLMRQIREVLRLKHERSLSHRAIAGACGVGLGTVAEYLGRAMHTGLPWPLPAEMDDAALEARLFPAPGPALERVAPDLVWIHQELKRAGVTLHLLWEEYRGTHVDGYGYSQFCELYRRWARKLRPTMRQVHRAGEKTFVDFSGKRPQIVDPKTGAVIPVELFVAALGASGYTHAEATLTQQLPDWTAAHVHMLEYFEGATELWVPDQLRSAVARSCRYEPEVNRSYQELARHYGAVVIPARPGKAKDRPGSSGWCGSRTLDPGPPAQPDLLLPGGTQRSDCGPARGPQRPQDAEARRELWEQSPTTNYRRFAPTP